MKTKSLLFSLLMLVSFSAFAQEPAQNVKKYGFKSAIVKTVTDMMGQKIESLGYIDNYGALEIQKVAIDVPGMGKMETGVLNRDGKSWQINYTMKQIEESPVEEQVNFLNLTDEDIKKYNIKEVGKETIMDKECTKYTMENEVQGIKAMVTSWVYKGLAVKTVSEVQGIKIEATVTEFQEDVMVLPQMFDIPKF